MSVGTEEEEAEATRMAKEEAELEGEEEDEYELLSHGEDGMSDDGSSGYPTTTTLTSRGRVLASSQGDPCHCHLRPWW